MSHSQFNRTDVYTETCMAVLVVMSHSQFHRIEACTETCMTETVIMSQYRDSTGDDSRSSDEHRM